MDRAVDGLRCRGRSRGFPKFDSGGDTRSAASTTRCPTHDARRRHHVEPDLAGIRALGCAGRGDFPRLRDARAQPAGFPPSGCDVGCGAVQRRRRPGNNLGTIGIRFPVTASSPTQSAQQRLVVRPRQHRGLQRLRPESRIVAFLGMERRNTPRSLRGGGIVGWKYSHRSAFSRSISEEASGGERRTSIADYRRRQAKVEGRALSKIELGGCRRRLGIRDARPRQRGDETGRGERLVDRLCGSSRGNGRSVDGTRVCSQGVCPFPSMGGSPIFLVRRKLISGNFRQTNSPFLPTVEPRKSLTTRGSTWSPKPTHCHSQHRRC